MKKLLTVIAFAVIGLSASATTPSDLTDLFGHDFQSFNSTAVKISPDTLSGGCMSIYAIEYGLKSVVMNDITKIFAKYSDVEIVKGWHFDGEKYILYAKLKDTKIYSIFYVEKDGDNLFVTVNTIQLN